ncbi:MAG: hypothetical protein A2Z72_03655 [Omnitrophica bacterium RBG_13_46_9]|nr:MAG: hypothetical protein A2Z72_03655 [Omnitrophica bacterium RBG_13_46_9]
MRTGFILFLIISIGIIAYSGSLGGDFIWDDAAFIIYNDFIKDLSLIPAYFMSQDALAKGVLSGENYRPFLSLSYALDYSVWRLNPLGYHITNLFFHILNAIILFFIVLSLVKNRLIGLLASLFFLTHPIQTESVTWISGRSDVLFLFFYLASLAAYINRGDKGHLLYSASILLFACSMLSKEMAASLPVVLILYDSFYGKKEKISERAIRYLPFFLILELYIIVRFDIIGKLAQCDYWTGNIYTTALSMSRGVIYYIRLLVYPVGLCADYLTFPVSRSIRDVPTVISIAAIALLLAGAIRLRRLNRHISFSVLWFFITLGPVTNIIPIQILIAERFLYLPSIGYCIIIAVSVVWLFEKLKKTEQGRIAAGAQSLIMLKTLRYSVICFAAILVCVYACLTARRNADWANEIVFNKKIIESFPDNYRARLNLSVGYYNAGEIDKSYEEAVKAAKTAPEDYPFARKMMANYYVRKNRLDDAVKEYKEILKTDPSLFRAHISLALLYEHQAKYDLAHSEYRKALALCPDSTEAKVAIATLCLVKGDYDSGIREFNKILSDAPVHHYRSFYAAAYLRLGELYFAMGDKESAVRAWQKVCLDFSDQIWFNEISKYLAGKIALEELLLRTESWQPDFKIISYYYIGLKREMDGDTDGAKFYYLKALATVTHASGQIRSLAVARLGKLEK